SSLAVATTRPHVGSSYCPSGRDGPSPTTSVPPVRAGCLWPGTVASGCVGRRRRASCRRAGRHARPRRLPGSRRPAAHLGPGAWLAMDASRPAEPFRGLLLRHRGRTGLSQRELAARLGVHVRSVQDWEAGLNHPSATRLEALIGVLLEAGGLAP